MRYLFYVLAALSFFAVAVQYNDPDGPLWMAYYAVPTIWCLVAAVRPGIFASATVRGLLAASLVGSIALTLWYWPPVAGFWREQVWEMGKTDPQAAAIAEQSREGMGLMIATAMILVVAIWAFLQRRQQRLATI